jgi:uncharacterized membrane protein
MIRMLQVLSAVARWRAPADRLQTLQIYADLILEDARRDVSTSTDLADLRAAHDAFQATTASRSAVIRPTSETSKMN